MIRFSSQKNGLEINMSEYPTTPTPSTRDVAQRGEAIYKEKYQKDFEARHKDKFVAINVNTGEATVSDTSHDAVRIALDKDPSGLFHLVRVGHQGAFEAGWYMSRVS
jgi:hypothetical protein